MNIRNSIVALLLLAPLYCHPAEVTRDSPSSVSIVGGIVKGDADKLASIIRAQKKEAAGLSEIKLDSMGGDVAEAVRMGDMIKPLYLSTTVMPNKRCASACFFIWVVGIPRSAMAPEHVIRMRQQFERLRIQGGSYVNGLLGLHRPYVPNIDEMTIVQNRVMTEVQNYLEQQMVPRRLIDEMMSRPSNDIYWLNARDLDAIGEYRPDVEEFLIGKCGYIRTTESAIARGVSVDELLKGQQCSFDYLEQLRTRTWTAYRKS